MVDLDEKKRVKYDKDTYVNYGYAKNDLENIIKTYKMPKKGIFLIAGYIFLAHSYLFFANPSIGINILFLIITFTLILFMCVTSNKYNHNSSLNCCIKNARIRYFYFIVETTYLMISFCLQLSKGNLAWIYFVIIINLVTLIVSYFFESKYMEINNSSSVKPSSFVIGGIAFLLYNMIKNNTVLFGTFVVGGFIVCLGPLSKILVRDNRLLKLNLDSMGNLKELPPFMKEYIDEEEIDK